MLFRSGGVLGSGAITASSVLSGISPNLPASTVLGGVFSTQPVSAQVTVTCTIPAPVAAAPAITAPRTGQGTGTVAGTGTGITPPNTGDAGLADSSSSWLLFAIGGVFALSLAGFATVKVARR